MTGSKGFLKSTQGIAQHAKQIDLVMGGTSPSPGVEEMSASWRRSANRHGIDPLDGRRPRILTSYELEQLRAPVENLIHCARDEIDRLYKIVREAGYTVLFCEPTGVAVEHRGEDADANRFAHLGIWLGGVWSEEIEGTNGIGTCIAEERPVIVQKSQHFRARHSNLSCSGAPIFDVDGRLIAVLDVSTFDPEISARAHALTGPLTVSSAGAIEERLFRERFRQEWVIAVAPPAGDAQGMLLAVDGDQQVVGANRAARAWLGLDDRRLSAGISLWAIFERDARAFARKEGFDIAVRLVVVGGDEAWYALATPPERSGVRRDLTSAGLHVRPRLDSIRALGRPPEPPRSRGGLPPNAMRRVHEYIKAHLGERVDLVSLAAVAGLSMHHFARAFKQSTGITPHHYLTFARVKRAQDMLARTSFSLAEIAYASGFSDQSHLTRHFRRVLGTTPRAFRWSQR